MQAIFGGGSDTSPVFKDSDAVAYLYLLNPDVINPNDIKALVPIFHGEETGWTDSTPLPESMLTKLGRKAGLMSTYEAAWVDDRNTKLAVRIDNPDENPKLFIWRFLSDKPGGMNTFGRMADISNNTISLAEKALAKKQVVSGNLALKPI